jgi:hypothetical protein
MAYSSNKALIVEVESEFEDSYDGTEVYLNGCKIGYRAWDGKSREEISEEVSQALAELLREKLGWPENSYDPISEE